MANKKILLALNGYRDQLLLFQWLRGHFLEFQDSSENQKYENIYIIFWEIDPSDEHIYSESIFDFSFYSKYGSIKEWSKLFLSDHLKINIEFLGITPKSLHRIDEVIHAWKYKWDGDFQIIPLSDELFNLRIQKLIYQIIDVKKSEKSIQKNIYNEIFQLKKDNTKDYQAQNELDKILNRKWISNLEIFYHKNNLHLSKDYTKSHCPDQTDKPVSGCSLYLAINLEEELLGSFIFKIIEEFSQNTHLWLNTFINIHFHFIQSKEMNNNQKNNSHLKSHEIQIFAQILKQSLSPQLKTRFNEITFESFFEYLSYIRSSQYEKILLEYKKSILITNDQLIAHCQNFKFTEHLIIVPQNKELDFLPFSIGRYFYAFETKRIHHQVEKNTKYKSLEFILNLSKIKCRAPMLSQYNQEDLDLEQYQNIFENFVSFEAFFGSENLNMHTLYIKDNFNKHNHQEYQKIYSYHFAYIESITWKYFLDFSDSHKTQFKYFKILQPLLPQILNQLEVLFETLSCMTSDFSIYEETILKNPQINKTTDKVELLNISENQEINHHSVYLQNSKFLNTVRNFALFTSQSLTHFWFIHSTFDFFLNQNEWEKLIMNLQKIEKTNSLSEHSNIHLIYELSYLKLIEQHHLMINHFKLWVQIFYDLVFQINHHLQERQNLQSHDNTV